MPDILYPRTVTLKRPNATTGIGGLPYGGLLSSKESQVTRPMRASIQYDRLGRAPLTGIPGDTSGRTMWKIFLPDAANGTVHARDIIVDDLGVRYQVVADYWNSLGYALQCERLES